MATTLLQRFRDIICTHGGTSAIVTPEGSITYAELDELAARVASVYVETLRASGYPEQPPYSVHTMPVLGFHHDRCSAHVIAALGAAKAGIAYAPLGLDWPQERLRAVRKNCNLFAVVGEKDPSLPRAWSEGLPCLSLDELCHGETADAASVRAVHQDYGDMPVPLYVIHTSGSTGIPKGVASSHNGIATAFADTTIAGFEPGARVLFGGALTFDLSIIEVWASLLNGCTILPTAKETLLDARALCEHLERWRIDNAVLPTSVLHVVASQDPTIFRDMRGLSFGGEVPNRQIINKVLSACPGLRLTNLYGTAETAAVSSTEDARASFDKPNVPAGYPLGKSELLIVDENLVPLPNGESGELLIGGPGVGLGYINDRIRTELSFITLSGGIYYRTGDVGYIAEDGKLVLSGRLDAQFKISGHRVDPAEISRAFMQEPDVANVHISFLHGAYPCIVAHVVLKTGPGDDAAAAALRVAVGACLPAYMVPAHVFFLDKLPLTTHGKVDQRALPMPFAEERGENDVCADFRKALKNADFAEDDSFIGCGGTSLTAARLIVEFRRRYNIAVPFALFSQPHTARVVRLFIENARHIQKGKNSNASAGEVGQKSRFIVSTSDKSSEQITVEI